MRVGRTATAVATAVAAAVLLLSGPAAASDDPYFPQQYGVRQVDAPAAWATSTGKGVTIAIVDTGVDLKHPDLAGKLVPGKDFVDGDDVPQDEHGHGTHVAGIAAAATGNQVGIAGVAPDAKIMPVRVLDADGEGYASDVIAGVTWAVDHGADVVNLSLAGQVTLLDAVLGNDLEAAADYAWDHGALLVAAAGNTTAAGATQPSGYHHDVKAIIVTATDADEGHPSYANRADTQWSLAAPGDEIVSAWPGGGYAILSGTSMATPHVAGAAALLFAEGLSNRQVVDHLLSTAHRLGAASSDGAGLLDTAAAVKADEPDASKAASSPPVSATVQAAPPAGRDAPAGTVPPAASRTDRRSAAAPPSTAPVATVAPPPGNRMQPGEPVALPPAPPGAARPSSDDRGGPGRAVAAVLALGLVAVVGGGGLLLGRRAA